MFLLYISLELFFYVSSAHAWGTMNTKQRFDLSNTIDQVLLREEGGSIRHGDVNVRVDVLEAG